MNLRLTSSLTGLKVVPFLLLLAASLTILTACVSPRQYRSQYEVCTATTTKQCRSPAAGEDACAQCSLEAHSVAAAPGQDYLLGFIEFDDQGQLWDRGQMRAVLDRVAQESSRRELLMVVFVHGWQHSAKAGDSNIAQFQQALSRLGAMESSMNPGSARKVFGLYLGWRGRSVSAPVLKELTFWNRKKTAHKVGHGGATEVLSRLGIIRQAKHEIANRERRQSHTRLVVIGHSFGGAVVYSALDEILEHGFVQTQGPGGVVGDTVGFGDLVVLINPAFEALRYASLSDMSTERGRYWDTQLPVLAVLTSEADNATKTAFPFGRWFSTLFERERKVERVNAVTGEQQVIKQKAANLRTIGHFEPYITHSLVADDEMSKAQIAAMPFDPNAEIATLQRARSDWTTDQPGSRIQFPGSSLTRTDDSAGRNPYLNIRVDRELIRNHNDITDPRIGSFVRHLILMASHGKPGWQCEKPLPE